MRLLYIIILTGMLCACEKKDVLTESQLRYNKAMAGHLQLLAQAQAILDEKVSGHFLQDLNQLIYVKEKLEAADDIFIQAKMVAVDIEQGVKLKHQIRTYEIQAAEMTLTLLNKAVQRTLAFQKKVEEMPLVPMGGGALQDNAMVAYLGKEYNAGLRDCCLDHLSSLEIFMRGSDKDVIYQLRTRIVNVEQELARILSDEAFLSEYLTQLTHYQAQIETFN